MRNRKNDANRRSRAGGAHAAPAPKASARPPRKAARAPETAADAPEQAALSQEAARQDTPKRETRKEARAREKAQREEQRRAKKELAREARKRTLKKLKITAVIVLVLLVLLAGAAAYGSYRVTVSETNLPNVYMKGVFVGGMTQAEALAALNAQGWEETANADLAVSLPCDAGFSVNVAESGVMLTGPEAAAQAYAYGHSRNMLQNLWLYLQNYLTPVDVGQETLPLNEDYIRAQAQKGVAEFLDNTAGGGYEVDEENECLVLVKGAGEMQIDIDKLCLEVAAALRGGQTSLAYDHIDNTLAMPDFDDIYTALGVEPADAYFVEGTIEVVDEVVGCAFDVAQAQNLWQTAEPGQEIRIPLQITYPEITGEELRSLLFRDKLGFQTTSYSGSDSNRINNIHLAAEKLNGLILMPGEEFSYNGTVGERTEANGFKAADAYANGEVVKEIGGGICQVSSTLYCATMYANLETVARTNHYFKVSYLGYAMDATVSWGGPDFRFANNRDYPVKIVTSCDDEARSLTIEIWGTDVDGSYVELRSSTAVIYDEEYTSVVVGHGSVCYRTVYDKDGNKIAEIREPYGIYHLHDWEIKWPKDKNKDKDKSKDKNKDDSSSGESSSDTTPEPDDGDDPYAGLGGDD